MKKYFSQARFNYFNTDIIKTDDLGDINIVTNKIVGNEQPKKTGVLSDKMMSTLAIVKKETNSWKWPMLQLVFMTGLAYVSSFIVFNIFAVQLLINGSYVININKGII